MTRYIFITGGVVSSLGKGIVTSSLASLLKLSNFNLRIRKLDPYLNIDPGTINPAQHGEVFVTDDGAETDMDLGHYERFTGIISKKSDNITTGKVYSEVLRKERKGDYLGSTVQVIPHVTNEIKKFIKKDLKNEDFVICEIGGTVGDIESLPFLEALRQLRNELGKEKSLFIHITLVPFISSANEFKTKPTQHSVKSLLSHGLQADILICRSEQDLSDADCKKIALFTNVNEDCVFTLPDVPSIYAIPVMMNKQGLDQQIVEKLNIKCSKPKLNDWKKVTKLESEQKGETKIAMVGKYTELVDSYKSVNEALIHAGIHNKTNVKIEHIDSEKFNKGVTNLDADGILVPGGFGNRGIKGMLNVVKFAREKNIPYFGICLGMQVAVIEFARNVLKLDADSTEFRKNTQHPVIGLITEWLGDDGLIQYRSEESDKGGTMRLGSQVCFLKKNSKMAKLYKKVKICERHRHRYEFNGNYESMFNKNGMAIVGKSEDDTLVEAIEIKTHKWFIGCQFHPEFTSDPINAHPLFKGFIKSAKLNSKKR